MQWKPDTDGESVLFVRPGQVIQAVKEQDGWLFGNVLYDPSTGAYRTILKPGRVLNFNSTRVFALILTRCRGVCAEDMGGGSGESSGWFPKVRHCISHVFLLLSRPRHCFGLVFPLSLWLRHRLSLRSPRCWQSRQTQTTW